MIPSQRITGRHREDSLAAVSARWDQSITFDNERLRQKYPPVPDWREQAPTGRVGKHCCDGSLAYPCGVRKG